jgi:hypothetical protein
LGLFGLSIASGVFLIQGRSSLWNDIHPMLINPNLFYDRWSSMFLPVDMILIESFNLIEYIDICLTAFMSGFSSINLRWGTFFRTINYTYYVVLFDYLFLFCDDV